MFDYILIYTTISNSELADQMAKQLVEERLVACANIVPMVKSVYIWQGDLVNNDEAVIFFKTTKKLEQDAINRIKALHIYELPCIVTLNISNGDSGFLNWINQATMEKPNENK
jgi:periplasmic divalent cation tolerance protein